MSDNLNRSGATRVNIMREVEASLQRLQTDYIDLYQVHGWDSNTPLEETVRTLDDVVREGKVRDVGLSNYMSWRAATAVMLQERMGLEKFVSAQMYYSLCTTASSAQALNTSFSRSPSITTSVSWFGVRLPAASSRVSTAAPTRSCRHTVRGGRFVRAV